MKLNKSATKTDWRVTLENTIQVDYAAIPTGEIIEVEDPEVKGKMKKEMVTEERMAFGFQTETGRGKGMQWVPVEDVGAVLETLQHYAKEGVENVVLNEEWLSPSESIHDTICKVPREGDEDSYDIAFRVRKGKGSKSCLVPEEDFAEFVQSLVDTSEEIPGAVKTVNEERAKAAKKAEEKARKEAEAKAKAAQNS